MLPAVVRMRRMQLHGGEIVLVRPDKSLQLTRSADIKFVYANLLPSTRVTERDVRRYPSVLVTSGEVVFER